MNVPVLKTHEPNNLPLVLVVDKIGVIGQEITNYLCKDFLVVFASPSSPKENKNIIHVRFRKKIPQVPDYIYSKIFIVDDGNTITRQSAFSFIKKAKENNCPLFFIGSLRNIDVEHADQIINTYSNVKVLIFGDLFDKYMFFDKESSIGKYVLESRKNNKINVSGNGLALSFPISFNDTIKLIVKASYLDIAQKILFLFYPHPITDISLANTFKKINPEIKVDFVKEQKEYKIYMPNGGQHVIGKYDLEEKIKELDLENPENREIKVVNEEKSQKKSFLRPVIFFLLACLFLLFLPLLTTTAYSFMALSEINNAKSFAEKGDLQKALNSANNSKTFFGIAQKTSNILTREMQIIGKGNQTNKINSKILAGKDLSQATVYLLDGAITIKNIYSGKSVDSKTDFANASNSFKSAVVIIQKQKAEGNLPPDFEKKFNDVEPIIDLFSNSSEILPSILGFDKKKTYLVLFQNNMELRPGGGFIGSYAILTVKNAKAVDFKIQDVYTSDGQLKAHVEPPYAIRRYLPSAHWYLRDSNFDPDFVKSAISAANIYSLETKNKVDGVIGIDLSFAKNIVGALGQIKVPDYNKTIDENNLFQVTEEQSEKNFFPGSTQKKDFLSALATAIKLNLTTRKDIPYTVLVGKVGESIKQKDLAFAFADPSYQNIFTANGWSSSLWDNRSEGNNKINDYLGLSEANLGVNKVNYYISRSISKKTVIDDNGKVSSRLAIAFKNNSPKTGKIGGNYKNYLQLILPKGSKINTIFINNEEVEIDKAITDYFVYESKGFRAPKGLEVDETEELDKSVFGFLIMVGEGEVKTISIDYDLPYSISKSDKSINYSLKIYKQPGVDSYPFDLTFDLPSRLRISSGKAPLSEDIKTDRELLFNIAQQ